MKVWIIIVSYLDGNKVSAVCSTKELAERELFKIRDSLVSQWKEHLESEEFPISKEICERMIGNLSDKDYTKWNNYPYPQPRLSEQEVIDK